MKQDIQTRGDVESLVNAFYTKVKTSRTIGPVFSGVANVNWEKHLPTMYSFWASLLLGERSFSGNPMQTHIELGRMTAMSEVEFSEWLSLFTQTVDELFEGEKAAEAKTRAANIARLMLHKIQTVNASR